MSRFFAGLYYSYSIVNPAKIVTFVWEKGEPPECGRHLRCRIRSERTLERLTAFGAPKGRQGIAQGFSPG